MRYILCCDYGLDDTLATLDILAHAKKSGDIVDIVAVGGHAPAVQSLRNAKRLVEEIGEQYGVYPNLIVDTTAVRQPEFLFAEPLKDMGGGNVPAPIVSLASYLEYLDLAGGEYALLSLAPLTVVQRILEHATCTRLVILGGTVKEDPDYHGYEFNHGLNRRAFAEVVKRPHVAVTLDTLQNNLFSPLRRADEPEPEPEPDDLYHRLLDEMWSRQVDYMMDDENSDYREQCPRAVIAAKCFLHPDWFETYEAEDRDKNKLTVARYIYPKKLTEMIEE